MSNPVHSPSMSIISPPPYQYYYHQQHHVHSSSSDVSRPSLGFPLGTALLLVVIFSLSGIFSCCYHWEKFRSLRRSYAAAAATSDLESGDVTADKAKASLMVNKEEGIRSVPVIMPGDQMPRFIAMPCPCAPLRLEMSSSSSSLGKKEDDETPSESDHMPSKPTSSYVPTAPM